MNIFERTKIYNEGRKTHEANKNIDLMTGNELSNEIKYIFDKYKNANSLNNRTKDIFRESFSYGRHIDYSIDRLLDVCFQFKSDNITEQIFDLYFEVREHPQEYLESFMFHDLVTFQPTNEVKIERATNDIKRKINNFTEKITRPFRKEKSVDAKQEGIVQLGLQKYKKNPLELTISHEKENAFNEENKRKINVLETLILKNCYEEIDVEKLLTYAKKEYVLNLYKALPEDKKSDFATMYVNSNFFNGIWYDFEKTQILASLKEHLSRENLVELYIKHSSRNNVLINDFEITDKELVKYYMKHKGQIPYDFQNKIKKALQTEPFENIKKYLESIDEPEHYDLYELYCNLTKAEKEQILGNNNIHADIKDTLLSSIIDELSNNEKLDMFEHFTPEIQKKFLSSFQYTYEDKEAYSIALYEKIKDKNLQKLYGIIYCDKPCSATEFVNLTNELDYTVYNINFLLKFSDDEIKNIYENLNNETLKYHLLKLNRQKSTWALSDEEREVAEKYNENIPESILINENTILHYLKTAKSCRCYRELLYSEALEKLDMTQLLECYKSFLEKKDILEENTYNNFIDINKTFKHALMKKAEVKNIIQLLNENICSQEDVYETGRNFYHEIDKNNLLKETQFLETIENQSVKQYLLKKLNSKYISNGSYIGKYEEAQRQEETKLNEINSLYKERILDKNLSLDNKYLYLGMLVYNYFNWRMDNTEYAKKLAEAQMLFEQINAEANKPQYNKIFNLIPEYEKDKVSNSKQVYKSYYNIAECIPYLESDKVYSLMQNLYKNNTNIPNNISPKFLNEKIIDTLEYDLIEYLSRYGKDLDGNPYDNQTLSDTKVDLFVKAYNRLKTIKTYPEENSLSLISAIKKMDDNEINKTNFENENNLDLLLLISLNNHISNEFSNIQPDKNYTRLEAFKEKIKEDARKEAHSAFVNKRKILDAIGKRFFYSSYIDMKNLKRKYNTDFKEVYEKYREKAKHGYLSVEEENELKSLTIFRNINELMEIQDTKALVRVFDELDKSEEYKDCDFAAMSVLEENIKKIYSKDLQKNAYVLDEKDKKEQIDGIDIYSPTKFNMFVHVVAAFGNYNLIDNNNPESSVKDKWNNAENKKNHILCTSYIGNDNMCYVRNDNKNKKSNVLEDEQVILGFSEISNSEIIMASQSDIASDTSDFSSNRSVFLSNFRLANKIVRECRHGHNEVDLERRLKDNKIANIEPEYIVCFNEISEVSKKVAKDFKIPIVLIDKKEIAKQQSEKLHDTIQNFKKTKQPELLDEIINLYQCARHSFEIGDEDKALAEKFFPAEDMNNTIEDLISTVEQERKLGNKENANNCYLALYSALDKEVNICKEEGVEPEYFANSKFHIRKFRYNLKQIIKNNNIHKNSEQINSEYENSQHMMYKNLSNERTSEENER